MEDRYWEIGRTCSTGKQNNGRWRKKGRKRKEIVRKELKEKNGNKSFANGKGRR